jgi:uncharacterized caspase-like protein
VRFAFIALTGLVLMCTLVPAHAEKRVALVIGNAAYRHADRLANPVNDARGMRDALKGLGFDVTYGEDLDQRGLRQKIGQFADRVGDADVAMVYFAGHGATFGDTPYVVPIDAEFSSLGQVSYELVPVETLIGELRQAKGVRIVILDACRDNAAEQELKRQASRGGPVMRGLAPMKNPGGLIVAYATQYLSTAADDVGGAGQGGPFSWGSSSTRHSPFTAALLSNIATPGLDVKDMFFKVGGEVDAATGGKQQPEISISMYGQYALVPGAAKPAEAAPSAASAPISEAAQAWAAVQNTEAAAAAELEVNAGRLKTKEWPFAVIELYLGRRSLELTLDAASKPDERCEAQFFSGEWYVLQNKPAEAGAALRKAVETCPKAWVEYAAAQAELKRLKP